jgi:hypothetical protein
MRVPEPAMNRNEKGPRERRGGQGQEGPTLGEPTSHRQHTQRMLPASGNKTAMLSSSRLDGLASSPGGQGRPGGVVVAPRGRPLYPESRHTNAAS